MLKDKISEKIDLLKKKIQNKNDDLNLQWLSENVFPYSCLVADDVMLTKNGEVFQVIKILLDDFKLNQDGGLREKLQEAISENTNDLRTAFWIQTVKHKKKKSEVEKAHTNHVFLKRLYDVNQAREEELNNYSTVMYITIVRQGRSFKLKYIKDYLSGALLSRKHNLYLDRSIEEVREITNNIVKKLSLYSPSILGIREDSNNEQYSELVELMYFLVNFESKEIQIKPVDATALINDSKYLFENGIMAIQNQTSKQIRMGMSFSLKETPRITMSNVSDIVNNTRAEIIITEYVSYVDQKIAMSNFSEQKSFLKNRQDKNFQNNVGLNFLDGDVNTKYCQSSISVMVYANGMKELRIFVNDTINMFSKHGIVMAREDISLERNYYAMMPANFCFTHRLTIHDAKEVCCFCYSYTPHDCDTSNFLNETVLFNIGTLKGNPVQIGINKTKTNIMIGGRRNCGKTVMSNFIASTIINNFDANIYIVEFTCRSRAFIEALGGHWYRVSMNKQNHTALFNIMDLNFDTIQLKEKYLLDNLSLLLSANNVLITPTMSMELQRSIESIIDFSKTHDKFALHDVRNIFKGTSLEQELQSWHSIGRYYHLFDNRDNVLNQDNMLAFHIDESITNNSSILAAMINYILIHVTKKAYKSTKPTVVILDEPFLAFGNSFFKTQLDKIINLMSKNNIYCIFKVADIEKESATVVDFSHLIDTCGLQIHFANKHADDNYGRIFKLNKTEYLTARVLANYDDRTLMLKQLNDVYSCKFDLSDFQKTLKLLSDSGETQAKIFALKESLQTDSNERWIPAYYNDYRGNSDAEVQRTVNEELKAIQNIKRLLKS